MRPRLIEIREHILKKNDLAALGLRTRFHAANIRVVSFVSSPGSGKTALLQATLQHLMNGGRRVAALVGDLAPTTNARRLAESGIRPTDHHRNSLSFGRGNGGSHPRRLGLGGSEILFIENVGNPYARRRTIWVRSVGLSFCPQPKARTNL